MKRSRCTDQQIAFALQQAASPMAMHGRVWLAVDLVYGSIVAMI